MRELRVQSTGAFSRWRQEIRQGLRTPENPTDALYFAAYCDSMGLDRLDDGELTLAAVWFSESARYYLEGVHRRAA